MTCELAKICLYIHKLLHHDVHISEGCMPSFFYGPCTPVKDSQCINNSVAHTDHTDSECTVKALVCYEGFGEKILVYIAI